jgi:hypothetical protein
MCGFFRTLRNLFRTWLHTICPADNATAGSLGRRRAGQLRFGFVAVSAGHIVCTFYTRKGLGARRDTKAMDFLNFFLETGAHDRLYLT